MGWYIFWFCVTVVCNTAICWYFWKSSDKEKAALHAEIDRLRAKVTEKM